MISLAYISIQFIITKKQNDNTSRVNFNTKNYNQLNKTMISQG